MIDLLNSPNHHFGFHMYTNLHIRGLSYLCFLIPTTTKKQSFEIKFASRIKLKREDIKMKQKAVIKVTLKDQKCRSKALKVVVGAQGIESVGWKGSERDEMELVGEGLDMVKLIESVRKKVGPTEVVSINPVKPDSGGGGGNKAAANPTIDPAFVLPPCVPMFVGTPGYMYEEPAPSCSIM